MSTGAKVGVGLVLGLLCGGVAGGVAGAKLGSQAVVENWIGTNVRDTEHTLETLTLLRAKQGDAAIESCEVHLNQHLFGLMPSAREGFSVSAATQSRIDRAKESAVVYRKEHPRTSAKSALDKDVAAFLGSK